MTRTLLKYRLKTLIAARHTEDQFFACCCTDGWGARGPERLWSQPRSCNHASDWLVIQSVASDWR